MPMIDCEFSFPKLAGVEWIMDGYIGAQPTPVTTSPARAEISVLRGRSIMATPAAAAHTPILMSLLSPAFSDIKPQAKRPMVIPK